jgi:hypothetical protein
MLWERHNDHPLALQFLRGLAEAPRVVHELADADWPASARTWSTGLEHPGVTVVDPDADVQGGVDVHDRGRRALAADVDTDPDVLARVNSGSPTHCCHAPAGSQEPSPMPDRQAWN